MLKRKISEATKPAAEQSPRRRVKTRRSKTQVALCPEDVAGPRIPTLLREFGKSSPIADHMEWLHHLELSCENQGCGATGCATGARRDGKSAEFARAHGAKTLMNGVNMFITYHIPRYYVVSSDDEWKRVLAALRSFHAFCVKKQYVKDDMGLMRALHRLKGFCIFTIPEVIKGLMDEQYWDSVEVVSRLGKEGDQEQVDGKQDRETYEAFINDDTAVVVEEVAETGWVLVAEGNVGGDKDKAFLSLPVEVAKLGMKGMSISCVGFGMRNGIWRPLSGEEGINPIVYPPDEAFY